MRRAGFVDIAVIDQTEQFRRTGAAWIREWDSYRDELVALYGEAEFDTRPPPVDRTVRALAAVEIEPAFDGPGRPSLAGVASPGVAHGSGRADLRPWC